MPIIGVPRALLYYEFFPLWNGFFTSLGWEVVTSEPTTKGTIDQGVSMAVDETCFPIKVFYGHFLELCHRCDFIFLPRLVSIEPRAYICPKFMGLPDLVRGLTTQPILEPVVNLHSNKDYWRQLWGAAQLTGAKMGIKSNFRIGQALLCGLKEQQKHYQNLNNIVSPENTSTQKPRRRIGVIGHPYTIYDPAVNMNLLRFLENAGYQVVTPYNFPNQLLTAIANELPKELFWTYGRKVIGAARLWYQRKLVDGIIDLVTFGCGTDSVTGEIIERLVRRESNLPFLLLTVDEHTGEAGFYTRLEAFIDMIQFKAAIAGGDV